VELSRYEFEFDEVLSEFTFTSTGQNGRINKVISFKETKLLGYYNLAFGDVLDKSEGLNDFIVSNNGDSQKVLATVVAAINAFTAKYPFRWIYAIGSTRSRTRLYQIGIVRYLDRIEKDYELYGLLNGQWQEFKKGFNYEAFLARRKIY
jgi:hypothetical protein